jgi:hypothetical protein
LAFSLQPVKPQGSLPQRTLPELLLEECLRLRQVSMLLSDLYRDPRDRDVAAASDL